MPTRNVVLTDRQEELIDDLVSSGRHQNASEVLRDGLREHDAIATLPEVLLDRRPPPRASSIHEGAGIHPGPMYVKTRLSLRRRLPKIENMNPIHSGRRAMNRLPHDRSIADNSAARTGFAEKTPARATSRACLLLLIATTFAGQADAQQAPLPTSVLDVTTPVTGAVMHEEYVKTVGRMAYVWGWPLVNSFNRRAGITQAPEPGKLGGVVPVAPRGRLSMLNDYVQPNQSFVAAPNQDVVYGTSFCSLDVEPVVLQVPDFGDRFWIYALYDARTDQFGEFGQPYETRSGFYLLVGPDWKGDAPAGITAIVRSPTEFAFVGPRIFLNDTEEDRAAIQPLLNQIDAYPLTEFDGKMKLGDWGSTPSFPAPKVEGENKWVDPGKFFDQLPEVMAAVRPLPGEEALYATIRQVLDAAARDPAVKKALVDIAVETEEAVIGPLFLWKHNGIPAGNGWNRSANNAAWGFDYLMRTATARSNMFENRPTETQYYYTDGDSRGTQLEGENTYAITFENGELPPVNGFWSLTIYNQHHLFETNDLNRYSLGTKNENLVFNADGSLTLYAGTNSPGSDRESNWLPAPEGTFSLYIRAYWAKEAILDGSWMPPTIEILE